MTARDVRVCVLGDSFVLGVGDPTYLGWLGRLARRTTREERALTLYNLGVRGDTSAHVLARFDAEVSIRVRAAAETRVVFAFGVNDVMPGSSLTPERSTANLARLLDRAAASALPALVVGPTPVVDVALDERIAQLNRSFRACCAGRSQPFVDVHRHLRGSAWLSEARLGDGAHPAAEGYAELAELAAGPWSAWLAVPA